MRTPIAAEVAAEVEAEQERRTSEDGTRRVEGRPRPRKKPSASETVTI